MALIEVFHVVASHLPIDATATPDIPQGSLVTLGSDGNVALCDGETEYALGIAGDSRSAGTTSYTPESGSAGSRNPTTSLTGALVLGAYGGAARFTQNRVADNFNEVLASGKMTVYHGGGEFWTDQYETLHDNGTTVADYVPGTRLFCSGPETNTSTDLEANLGGRFTDQARLVPAPTGSELYAVGMTLAGPLEYPSGVPGTGTAFSSLPEGGNSISFGSFLHVQLQI